MTDQAVSQKPLRAALYLRCSTADQTTANQLPQLHNYVQFHGWEIAEIYTDEDQSGKKTSRPQFDRMMADAREKKFDVVVVVKLDRLGRSMKHLLDTLDVLNKLNIAFASATQNIDTTTAAGKLMFNLLGAFAEFEATLISERTKAGLIRVVSEGTQLGRPLNDTDWIKLNQLKSEGRSARYISRTMNVPLTTVRRRLAEAA